MTDGLKPVVRLPRITADFLSKSLTQMVGCCDTSSCEYYGAIKQARGSLNLGLWLHGQEENR